MEHDREISCEAMTWASAMNGPMVVRSLFLSGQEQRVAQAMRAAVELSLRGPHGPSLPEILDRAGRSIVSETEDACRFAGLDETQSATLMGVCRRGIEAFIRACGLTMMEEIRAGRFEPGCDAILHRIDQILPRTLGVDQVGSSTPLAAQETPGRNGLVE